MPLFPGPDAVFTLLALANAVHDLRILAKWLSSRGNQMHVCVGMSLGAYVGQLWASLDPLAAAVFLVPLVSMGDLAHKAGKAKGLAVTRADLRNLFSDHCCLERQPKTPQEVMLIIGGRGDLMVPREQISLLKGHWPHAQFMWMAGGHAAHVRRGEAFRRIREFLSPIAISAGGTL
jgi:pimeloyl-ACP methyl ester carboxylesterase